jgi:predicted aspartyl protease
MTEARVRFGDVEVTTLVIFGDEGASALLGAYTLEGLGLAVDTVNRRLVPMTGSLM